MMLTFKQIVKAIENTEKEIKRLERELKILKRDKQYLYNDLMRTPEVREIYYRYMQNAWDLVKEKIEEKKKEG